MTVRCIHRHTIQEHPKCFMEGKVKESKEPKEKKWYDELRIGYFDIEVDNLNADFGTVLSWAIKPKGEEPVYDFITKKDLKHSDKPDVRVVSSFIEEMRKYDILIGYFSSNFDMPYMRAKALHYGLDFPEYGDLYHWDLYYTVKSKLKISRKSLDAACDYLNIEGKTPIDKDVWRRAKYADKEAVAEVVDHNLGDVIITEALHDKLSFTRKWIKSSV